MTDERTYLQQLEHALTQGGVDHSDAAAVVAEVADHLAQSGEQPQEAFGEPDTYAAALLEADEQDGGADAGPGFEARTFRATAADELRILADLGDDGWELTGVRDFGLHARRPTTAEGRETWEYARRSAVRRGPVLAEMTGASWTPCGRWLTFHYFKRPAGTPA